MEHKIPMDVTKVKSIEDAIDFFNEEIAGSFKTLNGEIMVTEKIYIDHEEK